MSDENEHEHQLPPFMAMLLGPSPEELQREQMMMSASAHETRQFFMDLSVEQLKKLINLFKVTHSTNGAASNYYIGLIVAILDTEHNVCLACGKDHDKEFNEAAAQAAETPARLECGDLAGRPHRLDCPKAAEYGVEPDEGGTLKVMCKGCGFWSESLEDRMLRRPGKLGCESCINQEKWG